MLVQYLCLCNICASTIFVLFQYLCLCNICACAIFVLVHCPSFQVCKPIASTYIFSLMNQTFGWLQRQSVGILIIDILLTIDSMFTICVCTQWVTHCAVCLKCKLLEVSRKIFSHGWSQRQPVGHSDSLCKSPALLHWISSFNFCTYRKVN